MMRSGGGASCPVCGENSRFALSQDGFHHYRCNSCRLLFVSPMPSPDFLARNVYSAANNYMTEGAALIGDAGPDPSQSEALKWIRNMHDCGNLLEIGCSSGKFLQWAQSFGINVYGVELNSTTADIAISLGLNVFKGTFEKDTFAGVQFDCVYMGDVIEHLPDPVGFVQALVSRLRTKGSIVMVTPNVESTYSLLVRSIGKILSRPWITTLHPPYHLCNFSPVSVERLMNSHGCSLVVRKHFNHQKFESLFKDLIDHRIKSAPRIIQEPSSRLIFFALSMLTIASRAVSMILGHGYCNIYIYRKD